MPEIGATLREARMRARIDVSEIEAQTKIRAKYLRALENEEWDLLPGSTFVKSFLRTYGQALGLDGRALVEEYKLHYEHPGELEPERRLPPPPMAGVGQQSAPAAPRRIRAAGGGAMRRRGSAATGGVPREGPSNVYKAAVGAVGLVIVMLVYALLSGGGSSPTTAPSAPATSARHGTGAGRPAHGAPAGSATAPPPASLRLEPTGRVFVCLIGDGRRRIPGVILTPTSPLAARTYHARRFRVTLGNDEVTLVVNGKPLTVPPSALPIGYAITRTGTRRLAPSEQPTCE